MPSDHITLRLGTLAEPLQQAAAKNGVTLSAEIRQRLARSLKVKAPDMQSGNPEIASLSEKALKARWRKKRT